MGGGRQLDDNATHISTRHALEDDRYCDRRELARTDITATRVRRAALHHALLSYVFGTVIVAITVSSVPGRLGR
jgi:hypothetical protein